MKILPSDKIMIKVKVLDNKNRKQPIESIITPIDFNFNAISFTTKGNLKIGTKVVIEISTKKFFNRWDFEVKGTIIRSFLYKHTDGEVNYGVKLDKQTIDSELYYFLKDFIYTCSSKRITNYFLDSALSRKEHTSKEGVEFFSLLLSLYKQISSVDLQDIVNISTKFLNAKECRVYKINVKNDKLETYKHSVDTKEIKHDFRENSAGKVFNSGQLLNIYNTESHNSQHDVKSLLAYPLDNRKKQHIGVIEFRDKIDGRFNLKDELSIKYLSDILSLYFRDYLPHSKNTQIVQLNPILKDDYFYIGKSKSAKNVQQSLRNLKNASSNVLIVGEKGLGKKYLASSFRTNGQKTDESLLIIDIKDKNSLKEAIETNFDSYNLKEGGTLVLCNIEKLSKDEQHSLLNLLDHCAKRVISTSRIDLIKAVENKVFLKDLYNLLSKSYIHLPPLRNRREDIIYMAKFFLQIECQTREISNLEFSSKTLRTLIDYSWPGNIDELEKRVKKQVLKTIHNMNENDVNKEVIIEIEDIANLSTIIPNKDVPLSDLHNMLTSLSNLSDLSVEISKYNDLVKESLKKVV